MKPVIVWFRRNLRLHDNLALCAAADSGRPVLAVYIADSLDAGGASRWWLHHSLSSLDAALKKHGAGLVIRSGDPVARICDIVGKTGAGSVFFSRHYEPNARSQEAALEKVLGDDCELCGVDDSLVRHPDSVMTGSGTPYKVFTPFWKAASGRGEPDTPAAKPTELTTTTGDLDAGDIDELELLPTGPDWARGLRDTWKPGEDGALERLDAACEIAASYDDDRDRPDIDGTSRLSPHLHFKAPMPCSASSTGANSVLTCCITSRGFRINRCARNSVTSRGPTMRMG